MPAQIRPNRLVVNDRFPMLGFTIRTDGTPQRAEVTVATDPELFADASRRTPANFFSTGQLGPLSVPKGEAVYVVPPEVLARFIGAERLYFALATAPAANGADYEVAVQPSEDSPYVSISGLTGRSLRRVRMFPGRQRRAAGTGGYGENGQRLTWAGDAPAPGMERAATGGNGRERAGNGQTRAGGANGASGASDRGAATRAGNGGRAAPSGNGGGNGRGAAAGEAGGAGGNGRDGATSIDYDDGFGPLPPVSGEAERPAGATPPATAPRGPSAQALDVGAVSIGEMRPIQPPSVSTLGQGLSTAIQLALAANPLLTTTVAAARAAAELADVSVGLGPVVSGGFVDGRSLGVGIIFASGNRLGVYGASEVSTGFIASLSAALQLTVVGGGIESFSGMSYAAGFSVGEGVSGGGSVIFDSERRFLGVSFQAGVGVGSPISIYESVQRQVATQLGHATAFGRVPPAARAMVIGPEDVQQAQRYAPQWADLFNWTVPAAVDAEVRRRGMSVQRIQDAHGALNLDRYEVRCTRLPSGYTAETLLDQVRRDMNSFVDTDNTEFNPYSAADRTRWESGSPVGAIFNLDIIGPDNAAVVGSMVEPRRFRFTTVETPDTGSHPVSGHREFGVRDDGDGHVFYTRGADRSTHGMGETLVFAGADHLWQSFQRKLSSFINDNGGSAAVHTVFSERFHPEVVRILYGTAGAQALGAGEGPLAVELKYRMFIPSPVIDGPLGSDFGGDGRGFSYDQGTSRGEITAVVHLSSGLGIDRVELVDRRWGESTAYDSDDTFHVEGKPSWWLDKRAEAQPTERETLTATDDNLRVYAGSPGQRGIRIMAENASAVTIAAEGAMPLSSVAPDIDVDLSVLFRMQNGLIQAKALGKHDGFPAHELYVNGEPLYRYDPVAAGNGPSSLAGFGDIDVDTPWATVARTYTVRVGTQGLGGHPAPSGSHAARGFTFDESFTINWDEVQSIPQPTNVSCWAAAGAMVVGWRDRMSLSPQTIAEITGRTTATGLDPRQVQSFADDLGLVAQPPQSYTKQGFRELLEDNGPLWVGAAVPGLHAIVVTGLYNEGQQLYVRITDPWDRAVGTPGAPGPYASTHATGSRYIMRWEDFVAEYEAAFTDYDHVNLQILHSGGTGGRLPNMGGSTPPGYAQALSQGRPAAALPGLTGLSFAAAPQAAQPPRLVPVPQGPGDPSDPQARWQALAARALGQSAATVLARLPTLAAARGWTIGAGRGARPGIALGSAIGGGVGVAPDGALFRYVSSEAAAGGEATAAPAQPGEPLLITVVSGGPEAFSAWRRAMAFTTAEAGVPSGAVLLGENGVPAGVSVMLDVGTDGDLGARLSGIVEAVQASYAARNGNGKAAGSGPSAQALGTDPARPQSGAAAPGNGGGFPPPPARVLRSQVSLQGVDYDLFLMDGPVPPQTPPAVQQDLLPGEQITLTDWPYIDGPSGRTQGGVVIDWSYGAGTVANVRTTPADGQARDGWRVRVHADIGPGPSTPTETRLKVTVRTTFSRQGEAEQTGVSEVILSGSGTHETAHRDETPAEPVPA